MCVCAARFARTIAKGRLVRVGVIGKVSRSLYSKLDDYVDFAGDMKKKEGIAFVRCFIFLFFAESSF